MKTTYYLTATGVVLKATTVIAKEKLKRMAFATAISPKIANEKIKNGAQYVKIQDL